MLILMVKLLTFIIILLLIIVSGIVKLNKIT